jgi:hypothetical protein
MESKMKHTKQSTEQAIAHLRETLKPGDTVYTVLRHTSRSGMSRSIDAYVMVDNQPRWISLLAAKATGLNFDERREAVKMGGCGMDMGFALVYDLSHALFGGGFDCIGEGCPANDHRNARDTHCAVCTAAIEGEPRYRRQRHAVCSQTCASGQWCHNDGGYALNHKWM